MRVRFQTSDEGTGCVLIERRGQAVKLLRKELLREAESIGLEAAILLGITELDLRTSEQDLVVERAAEYLKGSRTESSTVSLPW